MGLFLLGLESSSVVFKGTFLSCVSLSEVDIEGIEFTPVEMDSSGSSSDAEEQYSFQGSSSDTGHAPSHRLSPRLV